jgi:hypothetical protein
MIIRSRGARCATISAVCALFLFAQAAWGESGKDGNSWKFEVTPYLFASGLDGTVGLRGVEADVDISFGDVFDRLDKALMLYASAQRGDWVFGFDGMYVELAGEQAPNWQGPLGNNNTAQLNVDMTEEIYSLEAGRTVWDEKNRRLDVVGVARYTMLESALNLALSTGLPLLPDGSRAVSGEFDWWDAAIGVRYFAPFAEKWAFVGYADVGAGGSDLTYQLLAGVNWQFSKTLSGKFGYRYFYQDYSEDDFKWDMAMSGAFAGLGIRW